MESLQESSVQDPEFGHLLLQRTIPASSDSLDNSLWLQSPSQEKTTAIYLTPSSS